MGVDHTILHLFCSMGLGSMFDIEQLDFAVCACLCVCVYNYVCVAVCV